MFGYIWAITCAWAQSQGGLPLSVEELPDGSYRLSARLLVPASVERVWQCLTQYENPSWLPRERSVRNRILSRPRDSVLTLEQRLRVDLVGIPLKELRLLLHVREYPVHRIQFEDRGQRDFTFYRGEWELLPTSDSTTLVHYRVEFAPKGWMHRALLPPLLGLVRSYAQRYATALQRHCY